ncbi:MAG: hypothetical protein NWE93_12585 [Candidatus Bathyarchaeota archaeon]|nr:hypothetical protein [Candidatus Bathyarchaeota archaeon]
MTTTGDVAKGILIFFCGCFLLAAMGQAKSGQTVMAAFMLAIFLLLLSYVTYGYVKDKQRKPKPTLSSSVRDLGYSFT